MTTLAELRLANMREQKKSAAEPSVPEPTAVSEPAPVLRPAVASQIEEREDDLVLSQYIVQELPLQEPPVQEPPVQEPPVQEPPVSAAMPAPDPEAERSAALIARVHSMLAHKTLHPNGAKATVDMSPALFHRSKRYCLDHGNVTLRQLFLDLMTAFLDEEGY